MAFAASWTLPRYFGLPPALASGGHVVLQGAPGVALQLLVVPRRFALGLRAVASFSHEHRSHTRLLRRFGSHLGRLCRSPPRPPSRCAGLSSWRTCPGQASRRHRLRTGLLLRHLIEARPQLEIIVEMDLAEAMQRQAPRKGRCPVRFLCADAGARHWPLCGFDAILCFGVLPHLRDQDAACRQLLAALRPAACWPWGT
jgi:hypothetical protein